MVKVAINATFGAFTIKKHVAEWMAERENKRAIAELKEHEGREWYGFGHSDEFTNGWADEESRIDPDLIAAIEHFGESINDPPSTIIKIVEIPDDVDWYIHNYDGWESIHEVHREWS